MGNEGSKKSTGRPIKGRSGKNPATGKSRKRSKIEDDPIEPVNDVIAIPAALIEIRELGHQIHENAGYMVMTENVRESLRADSASLILLVNSCIQTIKTEGLKQMPLTITDYRLIAEGLNYYLAASRRENAVTQSDETIMTFLLRGFRNLADGGPAHGIIVDPGTPEELEVAATVNPLREDDRNAIFSDD